MKKFSKILLALLLVTALLLTGVAFAEEGTTDAQPTATPAPGVHSDSDKTTVTIIGIEGTPTVKLYQIVKANYDPNAGLQSYEALEFDGTKLTNFAGFKPGDDAAADKTFATQIQEIANKIKAGTYDEYVRGTLVDTKYTANVSAGMYLALIESADGYIYNPVVLSAYWAKDTEGNEVLMPTGEDPVDVSSATLVGTTGVAKRTKADVTKDIAEGTVKDGERDTVSVGSKVDYVVKPTLPDYPANAQNRTFFLKDEMENGLTFLKDSMVLKIGDHTYAITEAMITAGKVTDETITGDDKTVAEITATDRGFKIWFKYNNVKELLGGQTTFELTYSARVNEDAVVGTTGNTNTITLIYARNPSSGTNYDTKDTEPVKTEDFEEKQDKETVFTYELAFKKVEPGTEEKALAGAKFGIYSDSDCTKLVDIVVTNENGIAVSTKVAKGTYYIKELEAPDGYSLNTNVYSVDAQWTTATTTVTQSKTTTVYTSEKSEAVNTEQVGWLVDVGGKATFYELDEYTDEDTTNGIYKAYVKSATSNSYTSTTSETNTEGAGIAALTDSIPDTKLSELPSTGGTGGLLITLGGIAVMALAIFVILRMKRRESKAE